MRASVGTIWYGINTYYGANLLSTMLLCMFGHRWANFPNTLPASASITSKQLLCFFLTWIIELPFTLIHPKVHVVFSVKGTIMPIAAFGLFGWCMANGAGISSIANTNVSITSNKAFGWAFLKGINSVIGISASLIVSQPDMASEYPPRAKEFGAENGG
jgi:NCS1 family nucleobase:cation symporter-1